MTLVELLHRSPSVVAAELRPPRAELAAGASMDAWIDTYHAVRALTRRGTSVFITDSAVGAKEEDNLRHLVNNLGEDVPRERVVPFLTCKHALGYCLSYADRARQYGFPSLVVLGGDKQLGPPRCVEHAWQLRAAIHERQPDLELGGWANPHADPARQVAFALDPHYTASFYLTQIVSHHDAAAVEGFLREVDRQHLQLPGIFGIFYYRSANRRTLERLRQFLPVPVEALTHEFEAGASPQQVAGRTIRALRAAGVRHVYISNLPAVGTARVLDQILDAAG
jgi:hypothetical protein